MMEMITSVGEKDPRAKALDQFTHPQSMIKIKCTSDVIYNDPNLNFHHKDHKSICYCILTLHIQVKPVTIPQHCGNYNLLSQIYEVDITT